MENCRENLISSNHFLRDHEPWPPMLEYDNGLEDDFGLIHIQGSSNSLIANHITETIEQQYLKPAGVKPIIIRLKLIKIAARAVRSARYITFKLCSSCPYKKEFYRTLENIQRLTVQLE